MSKDFLLKYKKYKNDIYHFFWYRLDFDKDKAEEMTQNVFLEAIENYASFSGARSYKIYLYKTAQDHLHRSNQEGRTNYQLDKYNRQLVEDMISSIDYKHDWQKIIYRIKALPSDYSDPTMLKFVDGLSSLEIAKILNEGEAKVVTKINNGIDTILGEVKDYKNIKNSLKKIPKLKLDSRVDRNLKVRFISFIASVEVRGVSYAFYRRRKAYAVIVSILVLMLVVATPGYAYASKDVSLGHVLYPIKRTIENIEYSVSNDKSETLLKFSVRRIEEADALVSLSNTNENIAVILKEARLLKEDAKIFLSDDKKLVDYKEKGESILEQVASKVGIEASDKLIYTVAMILEEYKKKPESGNNESLRKANDLNNKKNEEVMDLQDEKQGGLVTDEKQNDVEEDNNDDEDDNGDVKNNTNDIETDKQEDEREERLDTSDDIKMDNSKDKTLSSSSPTSLNAETERNEKAMELNNKNEGNANANNSKNKTEQEKQAEVAQLNKQYEVKELKEDLKKLEKELREDDYVDEEIDILVEKINKNIDKFEKEENNGNREVVDSTKALNNQAKYFIKKNEDKEKNEGNNKESKENSKD